MNTKIELSADPQTKPSAASRRKRSGSHFESRLSDSIGDATVTSGDERATRGNEVRPHRTDFSASIQHAGKAARKNASPDIFGFDVAMNAVPAKIASQSGKPPTEERPEGQTSVAQADDASGIEPVSRLSESAGNSAFQVLPPVDSIGDQFTPVQPVRHNPAVSPKATAPSAIADGAELTARMPRTRTARGNVPQHNDSGDTHRREFRSSIEAATAVSAFEQPAPAEDARVMVGADSKFYGRISRPAPLPEQRLFTAAPRPPAPGIFETNKPDAHTVPVVATSASTSRAKGLPPDGGVPVARSGSLAPDDARFRLQFTASKGARQAESPAVNKPKFSFAVAVSQLDLAARLIDAGDTGESIDHVPAARESASDQWRDAAPTPAELANKPSAETSHPTQNDQMGYDGASVKISATPGLAPAPLPDKAADKRAAGAEVAGRAAATTDLQSSGMRTIDLKVETEASGHVHVKLQLVHERLRVKISAGDRAVLETLGAERHELGKALEVAQGAALAPHIEIHRIEDHPQTETAANFQAAVGADGGQSNQGSAPDRPAAGKLERTNKIAPSHSDGLLQAPDRGRAPGIYL